MDSMGHSGRAQRDGVLHDVWGLSWKMRILGLVSSGLSSLTSPSGAVLGPGPQPQMGCWPEHLCGASRHVLFVWVDLGFLPTWWRCSCWESQDSRVEMHGIFMVSLPTHSISSGVQSSHRLPKFKEKAHRPWHSVGGVSRLYYGNADDFKDGNTFLH